MADLSILPASRKRARGMRFANVGVPNGVSPTGADGLNVVQTTYVGFNGQTLASVNGVSQVGMQPTAKPSLSGVIGNRFRNSRPLTPPSVARTETRFRFDPSAK